MTDKDLAHDFNVKIEQLQKFMDGYGTSLEIKDRPKMSINSLYYIGFILPVLFFLILIIFKPKYWLTKKGKRNVKKMFWSSFLLGVVTWICIVIYTYIF